MDQTRTRALLVSLLAALLPIGGGGACAGSKRTTDASAASFTAGVEAYLREGGDLCVARPSWPVDVTESDRQLGTRDAVQLPVLERLDVVAGRRLTIQGQPVTRYSLTARGRARFVDRRADLCVATISLDKVVSWELYPDARNPTSATVNYTYRVDTPAWMRDPEALRVFPAVARVIAGAGTAQLAEGFTLTVGGWVANELVAPGAAVAARGRP
jgi:hypothetical protein